MKHVLGTSRAAIRAAPLMLIDLETEEGVIGRSYLFCYVRAAAPVRLTMVGGVPTFDNGVFTGKYPGRFVGPQTEVPQAIAAE